eukprot:TRINITY_DN63286_c0_g1_i1.p1 TRINITY_DN63286_c0_g1~~TRINITY_DN63286_c0_g1_i1.p1  ORF type:complete len:229 (+),score=48.15 TRINITY_DN63286_c0_g1_i1:69-755(+)
MGCVGLTGSAPVSPRAAAAADKQRSGFSPDHAADHDAWTSATPTCTTRTISSSARTHTPPGSSAVRPGCWSVVSGGSPPESQAAGRNGCAAGSEPVLTASHPVRRARSQSARCLEDLPAARPARRSVSLPEWPSDQTGAADDAEMEALRREFLTAMEMLTAQELEEFVQKHIAAELSNIRELPHSDRLKCFKDLCMEWHPDKCPAIQGLATEVFQLLQAEKDSILSMP